MSKRHELFLYRQEAYADLPKKTLLFFSTVLKQYNPEYIFKVDDDVYLRSDRVPAAVAQWSGIKAGMKIDWSFAAVCACA